MVTTAPVTSLYVTCAVLEELHLVVSIGIASNKVMAKLASLASKPDGIRVIDGPAALQQLLTATPASRLPRCGGKVTETLSRAGVHSVAELQVKLHGDYTTCSLLIWFLTVTLGLQNVAT